MQNSEKKENSRECSRLSETPLKITAHEEKSGPPVKSSDITCSFSRDSNCFPPQQSRPQARQMKRCFLNKEPEVKPPSTTEKSPYLLFA